MGENLLNETNTSCTNDQYWCIEHSGLTSIEPYAVVIFVIGIFFIGFVWFLVKVIKKALKHRDPNLLAFNVAMSNQLMLVSSE